jgi:hypothetical protein
MLRTLLAVALAVGFHGPGKVESLGTAPYHVGSPTVMRATVHGTASAILG